MGGVRHLNSIIRSQEIRNSIGVPLGAFFLLSVGELQDRKNHRVVINAMHRMRQIDIYYAIAGDGELKDEFLKIINEWGMENNIRLLGYRTDIIDLCLACDCFIHPSVREGLGIAPLEAMACGLPLISARINGILDYTENEKTGYCISPTDEKSMEYAIRKMYENPFFRKQCGEYNQQVVKEFDIEKVSGLMKNIYKNVIIER